tara:strand:+ start:118 stop:318 length:201 start_codon:yes stop_codon:yes gene_type:complete
VFLASSFGDIDNTVVSITFSYRPRASIVVKHMWVKKITLNACPIEKNFKCPGLPGYSIPRVPGEIS